MADAARDHRTGGRRIDAAAIGALGAWIAAEVGASRVDVTAASRLAGGAVQDNWRLGVDVADGPRQGVHAWVLRSDAAARLSLSLDRATEYAVIERAQAAGVKVAAPIALCADAKLLGAPFFVQEWLPGSAQARRLVRDPELAGFGERLAGELGTQLARIHALTVSDAAIPGLAAPAPTPARHEVARLRTALDRAGEPRRG